MGRTARISDAEWEIMNVIWGRSPITANEVVGALAGRVDWNHRTIKTMLNRLIAKGALTYERQGKAYLYVPKVKREACVRQESRSFVQRVFGGHATPMLVNLVKSTELSPKDIEELRKILKEKEE
jgi:BlaI family transcriptional regulator, penicillinase repressor